MLFLRRKSGGGRKTFYKIVTAMSFHTVCLKYAQRLRSGIRREHGVQKPGTTLERWAKPVQDQDIWMLRFTALRCRIHFDQMEA